MTGRFTATDPIASDLDRLAAEDPTNPFRTPGYLAARASLGARPLVIRAAEGNASLGFIRTGWRWRSLDLPSMPVIDPRSEAWGGLLGLAIELGATRLELGSYAALGARLPEAVRFHRRWTRAEQVLELDGSDRLAVCDRTHRQRIRKAERAGCRLQWSDQPADATVHAALLAASMERRQHAPADLEGLPVRSYRALLAAGAGRLATVIHGGTAVSSCLVLLAPAGAYLQSSGSSAAGKAIGAHHFMVYRVAVELEEAGRRRFNLGGSRDDQTGVRDFKARFGSDLHQTEAGVASVGGLWAELRAAAVVLGRRFRGRR